MAHCRASRSGPRVTTMATLSSAARELSPPASGPQAESAEDARERRQRRLRRDHDERMKFEAESADYRRQVARQPAGSPQRSLFAAQGDVAQPPAVRFWQPPKAPTREQIEIAALLPDYTRAIKRLAAIRARGLVPRHLVFRDAEEIVRRRGIGPFSTREKEIENWVWEIRCKGEVDACPSALLHDTEQHLTAAEIEQGERLVHVYFNGGHGNKWPEACTRVAIVEARIAFVDECRKLAVLMAEYRAADASPGPSAGSAK